MDTEQRTYEIQLASSEAGMDQLTPISLTVDEALSRPYRVNVQVRSTIPGDPATFDPASWLRKKLAVGLARDGVPAWFHGIVVAVEHVGTDHVHHQIYSIEIAPAFSLLRLTRRTRVFSDQKPIEVVQAVLSDASITMDLKAVGAGGVMRHITQFEESDFAFVSRLLEQEGAAYWFTHGRTTHTMVIGDSVNHHPAKDAAIHAGFVNAAVLATGGHGVVTSLTQRFELAIKDASVRDYSESHPKQAALGQKSAASHPAHGGKHNEADYHVTMSDADATAYAARVADALTVGSSTLIGGSGILAYRAGVRAAVLGKEGYEEHMLLTNVQHSFSDDTYHNTFQAIPVGRLPWRPARSTPIPRIDGLVPALVTAAAGEQGQGNDGSYRVRLLNSDDSNDRVVRMAQPSSGPTQGMHFPLQINTEVLLSHTYGHPDRPIIAGAMINAEDASPVKDTNKTQSVLRTACGSQLLFEDGEGKNSITLSSPKGNTLCIDDENQIVTLTAEKDHKIGVAGKSDMAVVGNVTLDSKDSITITAATKIVLQVGGSSITIEPAKITLDTTELVLTASGAMKASAATIEAGAKTSLKATASTIELGAEASAKLTAATVEIDAKTTANLTATQVTIAAKAAAKFTGNASCDIEGALINVKGTGVVSISGAMIKNN